MNDKLRSKGLETMNKKMLATSIFGGLGLESQKAYEISSYKKDAVNLIANRITKKLRGYFSMIYDFACF